MQVTTHIESNPYYPILVKEYGRKSAIKILESGIPINRVGVVPSLQVPSMGRECDGLPTQALSGLAAVTRRGVGGGLGLGIVYAPNTPPNPMYPWATSIMPSTRANPCDASPSWCDYVPFDRYFDSCKPIDPVACAVAPGPAMTPANVVANAAAQDAAMAAYCRTNPESCAAYNDYKSTEDLYKYLPWAIGAGAFLLLIAVVK